MPDELILENLNGVADAIEMIKDRFSSIKEADDFMMSPDGVLILDAICMRLQIIFDICKNNIPPLKKTIQQILAEQTKPQ